MARVACTVALAQRCVLQCSLRLPVVVYFKKCVALLTSIFAINHLIHVFFYVRLPTRPVHALYFAGYEFTKSSLKPYVRNSRDQQFVNAAAGFFAEVYSAIFGIPYEVIKQRAQVHKIKTGVVPQEPRLSSPFASAPPPKRAAVSGRHVLTDCSTYASVCSDLITCAAGGGDIHSRV